MTTTYATDEQVKLRSVFAAPALVAVNTARVAAGDSATTLDAYRVEAQAEVLRRLAARGIARGDINNPDGLTAAEVAFTLWLLFTAAAGRPNTRNPGAVDLYAQNAEVWAAAADAEMARAVPVSNTRPAGRSFSWGRG